MSTFTWARLRWFKEQLMLYRRAHLDLHTTSSYPNYLYIDRCAVIARQGQSSRFFSSHLKALKGDNRVLSCKAKKNVWKIDHGSDRRICDDLKSKLKEQRQLKKQRKETKRLERLKQQELRQDLEVEKNKTKALYTIPTLPGEKKDVSCELPAAYSPQYVEAAWYEWWQNMGFFTPEYCKEEMKSSLPAANREHFVQVLPPPNVTGFLHLGHSLGGAIQDALARWHRMQGHVTLWNPGCDHAGIATQVVVEKQLQRQQGISRHQMGRENFLREVWKWKETKGNRIFEQMKSLGFSLDWNRAVFTLDPKMNEAVTTAFIRLHDEGLIYRDTKLVNWCCALKSTISDIEVDDMRVEGKTDLSIPGYVKPVTVGVLTTFAYPIQDSVEKLVVATTRLETMLGDTAVAVHPEDIRYTHLHGKDLLHPLTGRSIPIITDTFVDMEFGTGAVKITPAHDATDYAVGKQHKLEFMDIIDDVGNMKNVPQEFMGIPRFLAREKVKEKLESLGLFCETQNHSMTIPICSRSQDIIEPRIKEQWYVNCEQMARDAMKVVENGDLQLIPANFERQWFEWLKNSRDWCVSRQLWWGHRIPAYHVKSQSSPPESTWVSAHSPGEAVEKAADLLKVSPDLLEATQDEDVLDTWFSSALYPFSIFGWPNETEDLSSFYPSHLLETGSDIMFFWVARMIFMASTFTGQLPFKKVLFHGMLRDAHGRKMSKSLGNVIDPMDIIKGIPLKDLQSRLDESGLHKNEIQKAKSGQKRDFPLGIPECGADALRFSLCSYNHQAHFVNVDVGHIKANRNFCNKVWQAIRFTLAAVPSGYTPDPTCGSPQGASLMDQWILSRLAAMVTECEEGFRAYTLNRTTLALKNYWWLEFCDVYLECVKPVLRDGSTEEKAAALHTLMLCADTGLRALAPFMPYLTEELYQRLPTCNAPSVCVAAYPTPEEYPWQCDAVEQDVCTMKAVVNQCLALRKDFNLTKTRAHVYVDCMDSDAAESLSSIHGALLILSRSSGVTVGRGTVLARAGCVTCAQDERWTVHMHILDVVDTGEQRDRLTAQCDQLQSQLTQLTDRLNAPGVPEHAILAQDEKLKSLQASLSRVQQAVIQLESINNK